MNYKLKTYGFKIGDKVFEERGKTEKHALKNIIDFRWETINQYEKIELLGEVEILEGKE